MFGTRHRAAIGITEETDCLSVVVSEETGRISAAAHGELSKGLTIEELTDRINAHFGVEKQAPAGADDPADPNAPSSFGSPDVVNETGKAAQP